MPLVWAAGLQAQSQAPADQQPPPACQSGRALPPLLPKAEQVAGIIGVLPLIRTVRTSACGTAGGISIEELTIRQQITEQVLAASLEVEGVLAWIDYERAQILGVRDRLISARDHKVNALTLASIIIGRGSGAAGTAMQFSNHAAKAGNWIQVVGGAGSIALSILALREQGGAAPSGTAPNMLAPFFGRPPEERSMYTEDVWTYLNTAPAEDPRVHVPWKEQLIAEWVRAGRIGPPGASDSQRKIGKLTSRIADRVPLSIDDLNDRSAMLLEVRSRVSLINRDLRDLTRAISIPPSTSASPH